MNPRLAAFATFGREVAIPASVFLWLATFGSGAAPLVDRLVPALAADATIADIPVAEKRQPVAAVTADVQPIARAIADSVTIDQPATQTTVAGAASASPQPAPEPIVTAALTDSSEMLKPETPPAATQTSAVTPEPANIRPAASPAEARDECAVVDTCVDRYLWSLYQRTPKEDSVKEPHQRQVTVKKKGRLVTVTRSVMTLVDEDFAWKDPKAADHVGMPLTDYVIGGMDREFKLKLFQMMKGAEEAGLLPGITSAFRDDYRQSIASGLKAADNRSYHGGSLRGGYGHGLAADVVSVNGATRAERLNSSQALWVWIDAHGKDFGIGRPYLGRDPPHVAPIDGKEYADHRPGMKARQTASAAKPDKKLASRDERGSVKRMKIARSSI